MVIARSLLNIWGVSTVIERTEDIPFPSRATFMIVNVLRTRSVVTTWPRVFNTARGPREVLGLAALVVPQLLVGQHPAMEALREQYERARIWRVDLTDAGFFVGYEVPDDAPRALPPDFVGGDAKIQVAGISGPAGCLLSVRKGRLATFEGYTCAERWPTHAQVLGVEDVFALRPPDIAAG